MTAPLAFINLAVSKRLPLAGNIRKSDIYIAMPILVLCSFLSNRFENLGIVSFVTTLVNTNLFILLAFYVIANLLITEQDRRMAKAHDYLCFIVAAFSLVIFGQTGAVYDIGLATGGLAIFFWLKRTAYAQGRFIALVWLALTINILISPVLFQFLKAFILVGEVEFIANVWKLLGYNVWADGPYLQMPNGFRIRLVGACSVFTNLSFGFLCYASIKAFNLMTMSINDVFVIALLIIILAVGNAFRIGLMLPSEASYHYWHTGDGATYFGIAQFIVIVALSLLSVLVFKKT